MAEQGSTTSQLEKKAREFVPAMKNFYLMAGGAALIAAPLVWIGIRQYQVHQLLEEQAAKAKGSLPDSFPPDWIFYYVPWAFAGVILLALLLTYISYAGRKVVVTPQYIEIHRGSNSTRTLWQNLSFTPPPSTKKRFRSAILSDGRYYERIDDFFYPEFELLLEVIARAKKFARETHTT